MLGLATVFYVYVTLLRANSLDVYEDWWRYSLMPLFGPRPPDIEKLAAANDVDGLVKALLDKNPQVRRQAAAALGGWELWGRELWEREGSRTIDALLTALRDEVPAVRSEAVRTLGMIGGRAASRVVDSIISILIDMDVETRLSAVGALGQLGDEKFLDAQCVDIITKAAADEKWFVRKTAIEVLQGGEISLRNMAKSPWDTWALDIVLRALMDADGRVRWAAIHALSSAIGTTLSPVQRDGRAVEPLIRALKTGDTSDRETAAKILGTLGDTRAIEPLSQILRDEKDRSAPTRTIVEVLGKFRAIEPIIDFVVRKCRVRNMADKGTAEAVRTVERIGDPRAVKLLINAAEELDKQVLRQRGSWADVLFLGIREDAVRDAEDPPERRKQPEAVFLEAWRREDKVGVEKAAQIMKARRERILGPPIPSGPVSSVEEAVARLVAIYEARPEGFVMGSGSGGEEEVRRVGKFLNEKGGLELMRKAHAEFARRCHIRGAPRNVEFMWDGIGGWQG